MYEEILGAPRPIRTWTQGVLVEQSAQAQLRNVAGLPVIHPKGLAVMPDVHWGNGATVGSVIPTYKAIIPAAVGVDIGCGMVASKTSLRAEHLPDSLLQLRTDIEAAIPHGGPGVKGSWNEEGYRMPPIVKETWGNKWKKSHSLYERYRMVIDKHGRVSHRAALEQLGSLGGGNHFIEVCLDTEGYVWLMLHSGSRGPGNEIGKYFINLAKKDMEKAHFDALPDKNLAYLMEGTQHFDDYVEGVRFAQDYARANRDIMMEQLARTVRKSLGMKFESDLVAVNCHHNYVERETHFGDEVWLTRKGAVSAKEGQLGIIPGSMGAKSFIVRGKGNADSYHSCSHGAGRVMSRGKAKDSISQDDHKRMTEGVECRKDRGVIDESPMAYKDIDAVMAAQADLVEIVHTLKQVVCVKG